jgi:hypothetical protein
VSHVDTTATHTASAPLSSGLQHLVYQTNWITLTVYHLRDSAFLLSGLLCYHTLALPFSIYIAKFAGWTLGLNRFRASCLRHTSVVCPR